MNSLDDTLREELNLLAKSGALRRLRRIESTNGPRVVIDGSTLISFGSNDYLGLAGIQYRHQSTGTGSTGSRLTTGNFAVHEDLEADIARFKHAEAAIVFSTGYSANLGTIQALAGREDLILSDELNHASLIDGCRLSRASVRVYRHADVYHARTLLSDRSSFRRALIITDALFSMDGDLAPLVDLADLCDSHDCCLMVDDAHGTGVFGHNGAGVIEHLGLVGRVPVQMGTLSKAVGCAGGFIAGSTTLIELLRNKARSFMFSTAPPPANMVAARQAIRLIQERPEQRAQLHANICRMRGGLTELGLKITPGISPIIPLIIGECEAAVKLSERLEARGVWIPAIRPPTVPQGLARLRITVSASHTEKEIDFAVAAMHAAVGSLSVDFSNQPLMAKLDRSGISCSIGTLK